MSAYPKLTPGAVVGNRYRMIKHLGRGGMGAVFLAEDGRLPGKLWAVKEIYTPVSEYTAITDEARFLAECSHPGLAVVADFLPPDKDGFCYMIMEYIPGETLETAFRREMPFPWPKAARMAAELCEVLEYLHEGRPRPIIHRDLKPSNIMLDVQGRVRLIDFGTARHYKPSKEADTVHWGTLGFAAPEQMQGKQTDARTDLYTLGAVLFYLLSGGILYDRKLESCRMMDSGLPEALTSIVYRLLEEDPDKRYQRAEDVKTALKTVIHTYMPDGAAQLTGSGSSGRKGESRQQLIVVGSLTEGSGATFTAVALARVLNRFRIPHAVVELPGTQSDLYQTLFGEKNAPRGFSFLSDRITYGDGSEQAVPWTDGYSEWQPMPPAVNERLEHWTALHTQRLLGSLTAQVAVLDAGNSWTDATTEAVCRQAALILLVCGPSPVHLCRQQASGAWMKLAKLREEGIRVEIIANRSADFAGREEWLHSLPAKPLCHIPEFPSGEVLSCLWKGRLYADLPHVSRVLAASLEPVVKSVRGSLGITVPKSGAWGRLRKTIGL